MHTSKTILALSPYHGGSHKAWFGAWQRRSRHHFHLLSLPARKWKWRMRGAAMKLAEEASQLGSHPTFDAIIATDMMNLAEFLALTRPLFDRCPAILYMHENQTSYPLQPGERVDYHYALTNLVSIMAATQTVFNSSFNRDNFFAEIKKILNKMPDAKIELPRIHELQSKSLVLSPGIDDKVTTKKKTANTIPTILWNHRWDHDKQPRVFANALLNLHRKGIPFHVILCGEQFRENPTSFEQAKDILGGRILHYGYAPTRTRYLELLHQSDIAVSTANQEFFGISVLEAIAAGAFPVLPHRLNYPYLIPSEYHADVLYKNNRLANKLEQVIKRFHAGTLPDLSHVAEPYKWKNLIQPYDDLVSSVTT